MIAPLAVYVRTLSFISSFQLIFIWHHYIRRIPDLCVCLHSDRSVYGTALTSKKQNDRITLSFIKNEARGSARRPHTNLRRDKKRKVVKLTTIKKEDAGDSFSKFVEKTNIERSFFYEQDVFHL